MTSENQDFAMYGGDTKELRVTVDYQGPQADLTGATAEFVLTPLNDQEVILRKTTADDITLEDAVNGIFVVYLSPADTQGMSGRYEYEVEVTDSGGNVATVTTGEVTIHRSRAGT